MRLGSVARRELCCSSGEDLAYADPVEQGSRTGFKLLMLGGVVRNRWSDEEKYDIYNYPPSP
jgi:hypothetical protein